MNNWSQDLLDRLKQEATDMICVAAMPLKQTNADPAFLRFFTTKGDEPDLDALKVYVLDSLTHFQANHRGEQSVTVNFDKVYIELLIVCQDLLFIFISKKTSLNEVLLNKKCLEFCKKIAPNLQQSSSHSLHQFNAPRPKQKSPDAPAQTPTSTQESIMLREQPGVCVKKIEGESPRVQHWLEKKILGKYADKKTLQARQQALSEIDSHFVGAEFSFEGQLLKVERAFVNGRNMVEIVDSRQKMTLPQALAILRKLVDILEPVHQKKLAHGNINPYNVFFSPGREVLLTGDYLFDLIASDNFIRKSYSQVDRLPLGHLGYLAPEQLLGNLATPQSDFWALGYLLCYLLLGEPVLSFNTPSEQIVASHHSIKEAVKEKILAPYPVLEELLPGLLHEKPEMRFEGLDVILKHIMQIMQNHQN